MKNIKIMLGARSLGFTLAEVLMTKGTSGAENEVICSRESKEQAPSSLNRKLVAFTLAEVLITLAVIGVVAALTIPTVVHKYQQKQMYTQFMKSYNALTDAMSLITLENGEAKSWDWENNNPFEDYILPQLKYTKVCNTPSECFASSYSGLGGRDITEVFFDEEGVFIGKKAVVLTDGTILSAKNDSNDIIFTFDTNGKKGPNVMGRDLFVLYYDTDNNSAAGEGFAMEEPSETGKRSCNPSIEKSSGEYCVYRLITEGKMDY